jgi:trk system potassium uptake protein TrkH
MTITTYAIFSIGRPANLRHRAVLSSTVGADATVDLRAIVRHVFFVTLLAESVGFVILSLRNLWGNYSLADACWHALFHSVSAFCNAGFALYDDSLISYQGDVVVNFTVIGLIVTGGIGFPVILDLKQKWNGNWRECWERLTLHSKLMLIGTVSLLLFGMISFLILEWRKKCHTGNDPWWHYSIRSLAALQASTPWISPA